MNPLVYNTSVRQIKLCQMKWTTMYMPTYRTRITRTRAYKEKKGCQFAANIQFFQSFYICNGTADKTYTVDEVLLSVSQYSVGSWPSTNYCRPDDGLLTLVAGRLSSKPLIGIMYAMSSRGEKNVRGRQGGGLGFRTYVTLWVSLGIFSPNNSEKTPYNCPVMYLRWAQQPTTITAKHIMQHGKCATVVMQTGGELDNPFFIFFCQPVRPLTAQGLFGTCFTSCVSP